MYIIFAPSPDAAREDEALYRGWAMDNNQDLTKPLKLVDGGHLLPNFYCALRQGGDERSSTYLLKSMFKLCEPEKIDLKDYV